jgi:arabinosaccharide transport system substrate-binding protein
MKKSAYFLKILFLSALFIIPGVWAENGRRTVTLWTFAPNNAYEWEARKTGIEARFNIELEIVQVAQNAFVERLQSAIQSERDTPDIIEWIIENNRIMSTDPARALVLPLEEYTSHSVVFAQVPEGRRTWVTYGEHVYGLPHDMHPIVLIYNDTLWKSVGVDMSRIKTWDEFFAAAKKLTTERRDGKPVHYALPYGNNGLQTSIFHIWQQTGVDILDASGTPRFTSPEFTDFLKKWRGWVASGAFGDWDWGKFGALIANGTIASYTSPDWWISQVDSAVHEGKYQFRVRPLPVYREGGPRTASWGGTYLAIPKTAYDPALLYEIMEYMQYDTEAAIKRYGDTGMVPPVPDAWYDPVFHQPDPRFGGQKLGELQVELSREMPVMQTGDIFWDAINDFTEYYTVMDAGRITLEQCLQRTQDAAMARYDALR